MTPALVVPVLGRKLYPGASVALDFTRNLYRSGTPVVKGSPSLLSGWTFARASTGYAETAAGALVAFASGEPRITDKGLLVEEARTNLLTYSDTTIANLPSKDQVSDAGSPISGFTNSVAFGDNSVPRYGYKACAHTNGTTYTLSVFVQMDDGGAPVPRNVNSAGDFGLVIFGNLSTLDPTVTQLGSTTTYRVSVSQVSAGAVTNHGVVKYTGQSARTFKVTGYQFEAGTFPTSYIPTTSGQATRQADDAAITGLSIASAATLYVDALSPVGVSTDGRFTLSDGTTNNRLWLQYNGSNLLLNVMIAAVPLAGGKTTVTALNTAVKAAISVSAGRIDNAQNGTAGTGDVGATLPAMTRIDIGQNAATGARYWNNYIRRAVVYPTAFTAAALASMTL